ncbi:acetyltransferase (GNAT) family protein [Paenibacillus cellulosilyticus]|uniref:Acetyltransferase (GNAT) family protein n=1 Tax=Paenibacillus cellulosilyticus TaxID=375489 RepID=A0A2V2YVR3_9BACL|nr:GNAT family N-acetyltransferase [Paenibacillus cellulosilyticus]PWW05189.1 acetyltransferase (GNAT) family protein [Paenibacillus cellulosilyticus]QKS43514.1 GNAT family N-acetyltransferase [Paenibacillus cellulosilyticus]
MPLSITIRPVQAADHTDVYAFQQEYLDSEPYEAFIQRIEPPSALYFAAYQGHQLAGIIYGDPSRNNEHEYVLQGVAVNLDTTLGLARQGIGSQLMQTFEAAARQVGAHSIGVGSADDLKVELFYLRNGYEPIELVAKDANYRELERVSIHDDGYGAGKQLQEELRTKHAAHEVIFIFAKIL